MPRHGSGLVGGYSSRGFDLVCSLVASQGQLTEASVQASLQAEFAGTKEK